MSDLKPCPFCEEQPEKYKSFSGKWKVVCWGIEGAGHNHIVLKSLKSWNNRPIEDTLNAKIAELEAEIATMPKNAKYLDVEEYYIDEDEDVITKEEWERIRKDIQSRCTEIETPHGTMWLHPAPNLSSPGDGTFR